MTFSRATPCGGSTCCASGAEHEPTTRTAGPRSAYQHLPALVEHPGRRGRGTQPAPRRRKRCAADTAARSATTAAVLQTADWPPVSLAAASVRPAHGAARTAGAAGLRPARRAGAGTGLLRHAATGRPVAGAAGDGGAGRVWRLDEGRGGEEWVRTCRSR